MKQSTRLEMGERHALQEEGDKVITPVAAAAARAVFEACGGAEGWKNWIVPDGTMTKLAYHVMQTFLGQKPEASAEALYAEVRAFPAFVGEHTSWAEAPLQVRVAYEAFCAVYRQLWQVLRHNDARMAQALAPRPRPRLVERPRYLPKLSEADVIELQEKLTQLGYSEREIKYWLTESFNGFTRDRLLWDAEETACYRIWCREQAEKEGREYPGVSRHELTPDRPYLRALYDDWTAYYAKLPVRDTKSWVHSGLPSGRC